MNLATYQPTADPIFDSAWTLLQTAQTTYHASNGKYFQLLLSPNSVVADGATENFVVTLPSDDPGHAISITIPTPIPFGMEFHEWKGPQGDGYRLIARVILDGVEHIRSKDSDGGDTGWEVVASI